MNCLLSSMIESVLFDSLNSIQDKDKIPNDVCPICIEPLDKKPSFKHCCGGYSKKMSGCSHWVHVYCQIDNNENRHECSICKNQMVEKKWLDGKISSYKRFAP